MRTRTGSRDHDWFRRRLPEQSAREGREGGVPTPSYANYSAARTGEVISSDAYGSPAPAASPAGPEVQYKSAMPARPAARSTLAHGPQMNSEGRQVFRGKRKAAVVGRDASQALGEAEAERASTEAYNPIVENPFRAVGQRTALDVLDRRRHGQLRQRPTIPQPEHAPAQGCRPHRGTAQLLPLQRCSRRGLQPAIPSRSMSRSPAVPGTPSTGWRGSASRPGRSTSRSGRPATSSS